MKPDLLFLISHVLKTNLISRYLIILLIINSSIFEVDFILINLLLKGKIHSINLLNKLKTTQINSSKRIIISSLIILILIFLV